MAALIFATLGIALALHGRRAIRARVLNVAAVVTSVAMNVLAAGHGWRDLAIWAMPPVAYALASDTAIGVVRAWTIARQKALNEALADDEATPLAILGGLLLWLLRLGLAPVSTLAGFRAWVVEECPVAPGRRGRPAPREHLTRDRAAPGAGDHRPAVRQSPAARGSAGRDQDGPVPGPGRRPVRPARSLPARRRVAGLQRAGARGRTSTLARPGPRCAAMSSRCRTGAARHDVLHPARRRPAGRWRRCAGASARTAACPGSGSGTCGCGCSCGCIRAAGTPPCSSCGCGGAGWRRSAGPAGPARRCRSGGGCAIPDQHSLLLGRAQYRHGLRVPVEEHVLVMAPPRTGKTAPAGQAHPALPRPGRVAPRPSTTCSQLTSGIRSRLGPVHVFNPQRIGGVPSTFRWNPVAGCAGPGHRDPPRRRVRERGQHVRHRGRLVLVAARPRDYLRCLFHAAALAGGDMRLVARWALGSAEAAEDILARAGAEQWAAELAELRGEAQKTAATIKMVLSRALAFMTDPALARSVLPAGDGDGVDIEAFLARVRDAVPDRRVRARRQPGRPAVRRDGRRDPLRRRPGRAGHRRAGGWTRRC